MNTVEQSEKRESPYDAFGPIYPPDEPTKNGDNGDNGAPPSPE